jgi:hypothetical protein
VREDLGPMVSQSFLSSTKAITAGPSFNKSANFFTTNVEYLSCAADVILSFIMICKMIYHDITSFTDHAYDIMQG